MIELRSERLRVAINEPGEGRNRTVRFDRAGFIVSVTLDGAHEFCASEPENLRHPCSGGAGLCSEILDEGLWAETPESALCPKFGVGLLRKPSSEPYWFYDRSYQVVPFDIEWRVAGATAEFVTAPRECRGYALRQTKSVSVRGNAIEVRCEMENVGTKRLALSEYVHNFVTIDGLPIGPEYFLHLPTAANQLGKRSRREGSTIFGDGKGFTFSGYCADAASVVVERHEIDPGLPFRWTLSHSGAAESVSESVSFIPERVNVWTVDRIVSPEVFHRFALDPGERDAYMREWIFGA